MFEFEQIPQHLRQYVASQDYDQRYSARDQAVWRYIMRALIDQLKDTAHSVYFEGLAATGISAEHIPSIEEMNHCLARLGWRAVVVDGFIPPQVFMELQQNRILAIAQDMRSIDQILYTPAPDIVHEAAGHAPIIADPEYSEYLQRFGEIGVKAMYSDQDLAVYEAVRQLSIVKQDPTASAQELVAAEQALAQCEAEHSVPTELSLLGRLHWWTVEYGLVGSPGNFRLFGAGLLSSLGESASCLDEAVGKVPLNADAILAPYDITRQQPQLFVTKSCRHLTQVLEEFADTMCFRKGGAESVQYGIDCGIVATAEYSSGLQVSGKFDRLLNNAIGREIYFGTSGPTQLACGGEELESQGIDHHPQGFGSPVGRICNLMQPLEDASEYDLQVLGIRRGTEVVLEFVSGVTVRGQLRAITKHRHRNVLMSFTDCTVTGPAGELLFDPDWGDYDMAVGERIVSVYPGVADPQQFEILPSRSSQASPATTHSAAEEAEFELYAQIRAARELGQVDDTQLRGWLEKTQLLAGPQWLLLLELLELCPDDSELNAQIRKSLALLRNEHPQQAQHIECGLRLLDNSPP